ncbi:MAG: adenine phosphoribosyltransferase [Phycisphaerae bacterium]|nr:adenine phosphoribosyltransferase [Phycisphaerae bacterium]
MNLSEHIRSIPDWPKKGILFRDITPLLGNPEAFILAIDAIIEPYKNKRIDFVAAVEARGFIFGSIAAAKLNAGFVPIRKKGKLPYKTQTVSYDLEYGTDTLEIHTDGIKKDAKVLMIDDLLATGGTMAAACRLVEKTGGIVEGIAFLIELADLNGREKIKKHNVSAVLKY